MNEIELARDDRVVLLRIVADKTSPLNAFKTAILSKNGMVEQSWDYQTSELRWAWQGFCTLVDAQKRGVLGERAKWKPYNADYHTPVPAALEANAKG